MFRLSHVALFLSGLFALIVVVPIPASAIGPKKLKQPSAFPITITQPGSYVLESNITVPNANTTAILVQADNVTIDLNGFAILGPTVCSGFPVTSCTPTGSGVGISAPIADNTTVLNGTVQGMGSDGIEVFNAYAGRVERVTAKSNGGTGIDAPMVMNSFAIQNGFTGINKGGGDGVSTCTNCIAQGNASVGIEGDVVANSTGSFNGLDGISGTTVINSIALLNSRIGINNGEAVINCAADQNGSHGIDGTAVMNSEAGANSSGDITFASATGNTAGSMTGSPGSSAIGNSASSLTSGGIAGHNTCTSGPCP
jgi:hypothetical protein